MRQSIQRNAVCFTRNGVFMVSILIALNNKIYRVLKIAIMIFLPAMSILVFAQVVARHLGISLAWSEELSKYFFSWLTYLGAAVVYRSGGHVAVMSLVNSIKKRWLKKSVLIIGHVLVLIFVWIAAFLAATLVLRFYNNGLTSVNIPFIKMAYVFLQVPIANFCIGIFALEKILVEVFDYDIKHNSMMTKKNCKEEGAS